MSEINAGNSSGKNAVPETPNELLSTNKSNQLGISSSNALNVGASNDSDTGLCIILCIQLCAACSCSGGTGGSALPEDEEEIVL